MRKPFSKARIFLAVLFSLSLLVAGSHFKAEDAAAYYGEVEGYVAINFSHEGRGCNANITVMYGKRVQVYCQLRSYGGDYLNKTNWVEYSCWSSQCNYNVRIDGWSGWHPTGLMTIKKDDYGGQHAIINWVSTS